MSHTIDPSTVATMQGRELDIALYIHLFNGEFRGLRSRPEYVKENAPRFSHELLGWSYLGDVMEAVRAKRWTSIDMHVSYIDGEACWTVNITCGRGPCELHGNPHDDWHGVEAEGHTLPLAFARAALLACLTEPAK